MSDPNSDQASMEAVRATALLDELDAKPTLVNIARAARELGPHKSDLARVTLRLGCVSSFTFEPLVPSLELQALRAGMAIDTMVAPFGQIDQSLLDPNSSLAQFAPDVVLLAVRLRDVCPAIYESFNGLDPMDARKTLDDWHARLLAALEAFRRRSTAIVLMQNYEQPVAPAMGLADYGVGHSQIALIANANEQLRNIVSRIANAYLMDYDALLARHGRQTWTDPRMALFARIPVAPAHYWALAGFYVRHLRPLFGLSKKVLVLDADNTLWGGVVGDVGSNGISLGTDYPGNAYVAFQRRVLDLHRRGVVLCLASKNEPAAVEEVLANHPAMVLRREHFAAMRVNWSPKHENLRAMAGELNLGIDSFVFLDDSAVECQLMRAALPQVMTICLPKEPAELPGVIESLDCFDQFHVSEEDRNRGRMYRADADRRELQTVAMDMPSFYRQLQMTMTLAVDNPADVARAAQMAARTNQFNMHTLRLGEDEIRRCMKADDHHVVTLALADRFGDNGVVGLAVIRLGQEEWTLHMFLMSCRVLGRTVEQCFVKWIAGLARDAGARRMLAEFVPTAKNKPFADFYASCGFTEIEPSGGSRRWAWNLSSADTSLPDWMNVQVKPTPGGG